MGTIALATVHGGMSNTGITTISSISVDQFGRVYSLSAARPLNSLTLTSVAVLSAISTDSLGRVTNAVQASPVNSIAYTSVAVLSAISTDSLGRVTNVEQAALVNEIDTSTQFAVVTSIRSDALGRLTNVGYNSALGYLLLALTAVQVPINLNTSGTILTSIQTDFLGRVLSASASNAIATAFNTTTVATVSGLTVDEIGRVTSLKQSNAVNAINAGTIGYYISGVKTDALGRVTEVNTAAPLLPAARIQTVNADIIIDNTNTDTYNNYFVHASNTITISFDASIPNGFQCVVNNVDAGIITLSGANGTTLNAKGTSTLANEFDFATVYKNSADLYAIGDIT